MSKPYVYLIDAQVKVTSYRVTAIRVLLTITLAYTTLSIFATLA